MRKIAIHTRYIHMYKIVNHCTNSTLSSEGSHVIVDFLEGVLGECGECSWVSAAKPDGVMDALQHSQLTQVYLGWLRLDREGGREGGREGEGVFLNMCE